MTMLCWAGKIKSFSYVMIRDNDNKAIDVTITEHTNTKDNEYTKTFSTKNVADQWVIDEVARIGGVASNSEA